MKEEKHKPLEIIENLKLPPPENEAPQQGRDCPACGARSSKQAGLTHCVYCGHEFQTAPAKRERR
ncbi:hypothetical protein [Chitinophaga deserti]|uniref:hypothetical protein n=1 Tax=Chitinophaga deserti TaxID=2164099 RepID=UPI001300BCF6|nr:hypothetical protein [Chitinophaga deserti]